MSVVPSEWTLEATKKDNVITANVNNFSGSDDLKAFMLIAEYDANGKMINLKIEKVSGKLENYTYTVSKNSAYSTVFLVDSITAAHPLYKNYSFK